MPALPDEKLLSRPRDVVVHVGMGKTGTSSIQFFLRDNRDRLAELGLLYPRTPGAARHVRLGLFLKPDAELRDAPEWRRQRSADPSRFRRKFRRQLLTELAESDLRRVLFSDEVLFGGSVPTLRRLGRLTHRIGDSVRVVAYLRRQDDHMVSRYQQGVKIGWTCRLSDFVREDMSGLYDYRARLRRLELLVTPDALTVRRYEKESFVGGSLHQDFLDAVGMAVDLRRLDIPADRNASLSAESVEFLRLLNLCRLQLGTADRSLVDNRDLVPGLAQLSTGPILTLPTPVLDRFMEQWDAPNRAVAQRWFPGDGRSLFSQERKSAGTTTDQRLDPVRLDHFLAHLEVPEVVHGPLRRIAEREAAR